MSKPRKTRDRALQKRIRERMQQTGEPYQLAWRRVTEADHSKTGAAASGVTPWIVRSVKESEAEIRRWRSAPPFHRPHYSLEIDEREAAFGFGERLVMVPMRMAYEPDRMRVVAAELFGISGHFFALKLATGGYELRPIEVQGWMEQVSSFAELEQQYGSYLRIAPDPAIPWSGKEDSNTALSHTRLGRAIRERFRLSDFSKALYFADPTTGAPGTHLMAHFGQVQFEIIDVGARYARFLVDYTQVPVKDQQLNGRLQGEVTWSLGATSGDDQKLIDALVLVELHATVYRPLGEGPGARMGSPAFLEMMRHLRDHTGEVEVEALEHEAPAESRKRGEPGRLEDHGAYLYVLKNGRREHPGVSPTLKVRVTKDECEHLIRAGAWWVVRDHVQGADSSTA